MSRGGSASRGLFFIIPAGAYCPPRCVRSSTSSRRSAITGDIWLLTGSAAGVKLAVPVARLSRLVRADRVIDTAPMTVSQSPQAGARHARHAGLRYGYDHDPGISRRKRGRRFDYFDARGHRIVRAALIDRCRRLAVPPAWTDVWISPRANSHIQATGRDARGRKQYRYHADWRTVRDRTKFENMRRVWRLPQCASCAPADRVGA